MTNVTYSRPMVSAQIKLYVHFCTSEIIHILTSYIRNIFICVICMCYLYVIPCLNNALR